MDQAHKIIEAWKILGNLETRREYDEKLTGNALKADRSPSYTYFSSES